MQAERYNHSYQAREWTLTSLTVYNTGLQQCEPGHSWGPGVRDHYLLHYVTAGRGVYTAEGETYRPMAGDMFLARPGETITYAADEEDPWSYCWVGFHGLDADALLKQTDFSLRRRMLAFGHDTPAKLLTDIYRSAGGQPCEVVRMTGKLYVFLAWLMESAKAEPREKHQASREHVRLACEYIANNFSRPISVEDVARFVGVCRSRLYRAFAENMNTSPTQYLARFRMQQACLLLTQTDLSVKAVAFSVGFEDPLYFSRRFREVVGCVPSRYEGHERGQ
ncbi:MAG: AraC family transcriptional regulator [Firmicutes bacterium]|nr:AraC family transcriptional regulator [Bacillota bacterium]